MKILNFSKEDKVYEKAFKSFGADRICFVETNEYDSSRAFFDYVQDKGKEPCLIIFSAHSNLSGWVGNLIEDGFPIKNILFVGVRNIDKNEKELFYKIRKITIEELMFDLENKTDAIMEFSKGRDLYISFGIPSSCAILVGQTSNTSTEIFFHESLSFIARAVNPPKNIGDMAPVSRSHLR